MLWTTFSTSSSAVMLFAQDGRREGGQRGTDCQIDECVLQNVLVGGPTEVRRQNVAAGLGQKASRQRHELCRAAGDQNSARITAAGNSRQSRLEAADSGPARQCRKNGVGTERAKRKSRRWRNFSKYRLEGSSAASRTNSRCVCWALGEMRPSRAVSRYSEVGNVKLLQYCRSFYSSRRK